VETPADETTRISGGIGSGSAHVATIPSVLGEVNTFAHNARLVGGISALNWLILLSFS
jgi:hypothetical protein